MGLLVFDQRVAVNVLELSGHEQCFACRAPLTEAQCRMPPIKQAFPVFIVLINHPSAKHPLKNDKTSIEKKRAKDI